MLEAFFRQLCAEPESITFEQSIALIDTLYDVNACAFQNGHLHNAAGENPGARKILAFAALHQLSPPQTLQLFGDYYRKDVMLHPEGQDHQNIRQFIQHGWDGVVFSDVVLVGKSAPLVNNLT
jgi:hypothetical protein